MPSQRHRRSAIRTLYTTARRAAESDGGVQTADPDDCLDSDTLGEGVNCCLDSFVDEPADFQACADECANQCDADTPEAAVVAASPAGRLRAPAAGVGGRALPAELDRRRRRSLRRSRRHPQHWNAER